MQESLPRDASGLKDVGFEHKDENLVIHFIDGANSPVILDFDDVAIQGFIEEGRLLQ